MGKVEVKQTPKILNPYGEKILRIWYDNNSEPPKNYIWCKDDEYYYWNKKQWVPWEADEVFGRRHHHNHNVDCNCCYDKGLEVKFEKFKKDILEAVLKLIKAQNPSSASALAERIGTLETAVNRLQQIDHTMFVTNNNLDSAVNALGYVKSEDVSGLEELSAINDRLAAAEQDIINNSLNISNNATNITANTADITSNTSTLTDYGARISALESASSANYDARITALENAGYITNSALAGYATERYVNNAIPLNVSELTNDAGYCSGVEITNHQNVINLTNGQTFNVIDDVEYDHDQYGYKMYVSMQPYRINIPIQPAEAYDDTELRSRITDIENAGYITSEDLPECPDHSETIAELDNRVTTLEEMPFDEYLTENDEQVISAAINDLNDRVLALENEESGGNEPEPDDPPTPVDYVLTYDWNGGEEGPEDVHSSESVVTVTDSYPYKEGYEFAGWEGPQGEVYWSGDSVTLPITLTALWSFNYPEGGMFTYQAPQAEDSAKLINNDESFTYDMMYEMLHKMYNEGTYLTLSGNNSWFVFYPEPQGDDETNIALRCNMWTGESDESVYAYLEQEEGGGFRFTLDRTLVEEVYDEETGEGSYYQDIADGTEFNWAVSYGE